MCAVPAEVSEGGGGKAIRGGRTDVSMWGDVCCTCRSE